MSVTLVAPFRPTGATDAAAPAVLAIEGLTLEIEGNRILHDVQLTVRAGEIYGLLGPNGAGKSTTIAAALGLLKRSSGSIRVFGLDPASDRRLVHARVGVLPERLGFYDWMTATDYLAFFARLHGGAPTPDALASRLDAVGLAPARQPIGTYSHGMRQRLGLARALVADPDLLILDEPTNGLDPLGRRQVHDMLLDLAVRRRTAVLLCTHLLDDVDRLCSRVGILQDGRTVAEGEVTDIAGAARRTQRFRLRLARQPDGLHLPAGCRYMDQVGAEYRVELADGCRPESVWPDLLAAGWPIIEIRDETGGLEDAYLGLTATHADGDRP